ncbi:MAG: nucleoside recognition domain-containing protein, partial [Betaproteobacteria bacterium]
QTGARMLGALSQPVLAPLGIDAELTVALIFGFVAKEVLIGAFAVIYGLEGQALAADLAGRLDVVQAYSFMLFTLIYTPCLSTLAAIRRESRSLAFTAAAVAWPLAVAWVVSFVFYSVSTSFG